jgi:hypothetical protein
MASRVPSLIVKGSIQPGHFRRPRFMTAWRRINLRICTDHTAEPSSPLFWRPFLPTFFKLLAWSSCLTLQEQSQRQSQNKRLIA